MWKRTEYLRMPRSKIEEESSQGLPNGNSPSAVVYAVIISVFGYIMRVKPYKPSLDRDIRK
jgi:hypothetical protein